MPGLYNPVANPKAEVRIGNARFTVMTPQLIRMEWSASRKFEDRASLVFLNRRLPVPYFTTRTDEEDGVKVLHLHTRGLDLIYKAAPAENGKFSKDDIEVKLNVEGRVVQWQPGDADTGNLLGTTRTLDRALGDKTLEPIGPGLISRDGWAVVDDSTRPLFNSDDFRFLNGEKSPWPWVVERRPGDRQDWYFFGYGHDYKKALGDFVKVAGRIPLPPYFAFGTMWSRYWPYSDQGIDRLVNNFHQSGVPLNVMVLDMDWHPTTHQNILKGKIDRSGQHLGWTGFSWNKLLFPDPEAFLAGLHRDGLRVTLNLHPASGVQPWETRYPEMARAMGIDPTTRQYVPFDITNKKFTTNLMDIVLHPLEKEGVDFWWLDWQQGSKTKLPGVNPTFWLNYVFFTDQAREGKRPLLLGRYGGLGNHRYEVGFSGDTVSVWPSLAFQPWFTATAANVGFAYWSHDIGGHMPGVDSPELYTRWVQFGVFSPILRTHSSFDPYAERRIWAYPEPYSDIMRDAFDLRFALIPYIYTEARRTYDTGVAFLHPLYYDWPNAAAAYTAKNEYMFGNEMLVAPVTAPADPRTHLAKESIWLPKGEWIEWDTGKHFHGPIQMDQEFSIRQIPVYVRTGAIVPMAPPMRSTAQKSVDPLILMVFPQEPGSSSQYTLYEDARDTRAYLRNQAAWTTIHAAQNGDTLAVTIDPVRGSYPGMLRVRSYVVKLPDDWPPSSVSVNGRPVAYTAQGRAPGWRYEGNTLTTVIHTNRIPVDQPVHIRVTRQAGLIQNRAELDGFAGTIARLRATTTTLNRMAPLAWPPDALVYAMQTGDRLTYHPNAAAAELAHFSANVKRAMGQVQAMEARGAKALKVRAKKTKQPTAKVYLSSWIPKLIKKQAAAYDTKFTMAFAQMEDAEHLRSIQ